MRRLEIEDILGDEVLAKDLILGSDMTLMVKGTKVRREYVERLKYLGVEYIYVEDKYNYIEPVDAITEQKIKEQCQEQVREAIELYSSYGTDELHSITNIAQNIINDVLDQSEVIYNVCGIREKNEGVFAHSLNVCTLSVLLAIKMKMPKAKVKDIAIGCLLHDIGLNYCNFYRNGSLLSIEEEEYILEEKRHVIYAYSTLSKQKWISPIIYIA